MARRAPTQAQRRREAATVLRLRDQFANSLRRKLEAEFKRVASAAANSLPDWRTVLPLHRQKLKDIMLPMLTTAAMASAHHLRDTFRKGLPAEFVESKRGVNPTEAEIDADIAKAVRSRALQRIMDISRTTAKRINTQVEAGLANNETLTEIAARIREHVSGMSSARALTVARTEVGIASATAEQVEMRNTQEVLGITVIKIWSATKDDRTRETHADADGDEAKLDSPFIVGGAEMMHPMDPDGPPEEVINCRCVLKYDYRD